jgi:transcriptional regulator with XRE-family HTH domain
VNTRGIYIMARWNTRLRKAREAMKLSLAGAVKLLKESERIEICRTFLGQVERGECEITTSKFRALCKMYSADANWVLDLKDH